MNRGNYKHLERCKSVGVLTSALKMFLRELPQPLIDGSVVNSCIALKLSEGLKSNRKTLSKELRKQLNELPDLNYNLLEFLFLHLKRVVDNKENKMNSPSLAIIFGQNLISNQTKENSNIDQILLEAEKINSFIEMLITFAEDIFTN